MKSCHKMMLCFTMEAYYLENMHSTLMTYLPVGKMLVSDISLIHNIIMINKCVQALSKLELRL